MVSTTLAIKARSSRLRSVWVVVAASSTVRMSVVQERLGHHSPAFTQSTYQHLLPGMGEAAARRFEALVLESDEGEAAS